MNALARWVRDNPFLAEHDPFLEPVRGDPRFDALLERVREEWETFDA